MQHSCDAYRLGRQAVSIRQSHSCLSWRLVAREPARAFRSPAPARHHICIEAACSRRHSHRGRVQCHAVADIGSSHDESYPITPAVPAPRTAKAVPKLLMRALVGTVLGVAGGVTICWGGWPFFACMCLAMCQATQEYFGFVSAAGEAQQWQAPPAFANPLTVVSCMIIATLTHMSKGIANTAFAVSAFVVLALQAALVEKPTFPQLTASVFGLLYCGWLPSFWIKLRLLSVPPIESVWASQWPAVLGGAEHLTVGLVATLAAVTCIIAADTGAYFFGKAFGRTKLIKISPNKTVEGAWGGLLMSVAVALTWWGFLQWPATPLQACAFGVLVFLSSLFGDLIESIMKRDAGVKDSGTLIPGHGGLLDRFDSYMFTGAVVYFYVKFLLPLLGV